MIKRSIVTPDVTTFICRGNSRGVIREWLKLAQRDDESSRDHGREGSGIGDTQTATKAVQSYRKATPTGSSGLQDLSTKKGN